MPDQKTYYLWDEVEADLKATWTDDEIRIYEAEVATIVNAHHLSEIRSARGSTQRQVAATMAVSQARVSKIERGDLAHTELGTLNSYVTALGGRLRVIAEFDDKTITVH